MKDNFTPNSPLVMNQFADSLLLSQISPKDYKWDEFKTQAEQIKDLYQGTVYQHYADRMDGCGNFLQFVSSILPETGEQKLKLKKGHFCHVARCSVCQWRRMRAWRAKAIQIMPAVFQDYPTARFIFLTLTVKNPHITDLRSTLGWMNKSWKRLTELKQFPALGWVKTVEFTRQRDCVAPASCKAEKIAKSCSRCLPTEQVHPHFHCLLMVPANYFGKQYLSHEAWTEMWKKSLRVDYTPIVNIKAVKSLSGDTQGMKEAISETIKYSIKSSDILTGNSNSTINDQEWLLEVTKQLHQVKLISTGGVLKKYLKELEREPDDLIHTDLLQDENEVRSLELYFAWDEHTRKYRSRSVLL